VLPAVVDRPLLAALLALPVPLAVPLAVMVLAIVSMSPAANQPRSLAAFRRSTP
jgi:hypothetical protein